MSIRVVGPIFSNITNCNLRCTHIDSLPSSSFFSLHNDSRKASTESNREMKGNPTLGPLLISSPEIVVTPQKTRFFLFLLLLFALVEGYPRRKRSREIPDTADAKFAFRLKIKEFIFFRPRGHDFNNRIRSGSHLIFERMIVDVWLLAETSQTNKRVSHRHIVQV